LFELLIVFLVAAILTAFFLYSAQYLTVSSRISRVKEEHRVLTRALQNYEADYGVFPGNDSGLHALCAPVAYMVRIPNDPFGTGKNEEYIYISSPGGGCRWLLISDGPDHRSDFLAAVKGQQLPPALVTARKDDRTATLSLPAEQVEAFLVRYTYDPTNGLMSPGDIITVTH
jgi:type II secretory pathway pseudopilin PulG